MKQRFLMGILVVLAIVAGTTSLEARSSGITGQYQTGCAGAGCHGGVAANNTEITFTGPNAIKAGAAGNYTVRIANSTTGLVGAGLNLAFVSQAGAASGALQAGAGSSVSGSELSHTQTKMFDVNKGSDFAFTWTAPQAHGIYTLYVAGNAVNGNGNTNGDVWNAKSFSIAVSGANITAPAGGAFCQGASLSITWAHTAITTIRIELSSDNFTTITTVAGSVSADDGQFSYPIPTNLAPASTYRVRLVNAATNDILATSSAFSVLAGPSFTTQPQNTDVCVGATAQLTAGAVGNNVVYAWKKDGAVIAGATTGLLRIVGTTAADAGTYVCEATTCNQTVASNPVTLTVNTPPAITQQPLGDTICVGATATFSVQATGTDVTYQWTRNGVDIAGATEATYVLQDASIQQKGTYRCRVQGACPPAALSDGVTLEVITGPTINLQPRRANLTVGQDLVLSVTAVGIDLQYQWYQNSKPIAGATKSIYAKAAATKADAGIYTVDVINSCATIKSNEAEVTVSDVAGPGVLTLGLSSIGFGSIPMCDVIDTTVAGLVRNTGGTDITVTGYTVTPPNAVTISGITFPVTIQPGSGVNGKVTYSSTGAGSQSVNVVFTDGKDNVTMSLTATGTEVARSLADTVAFPVQLGPSKCITLATVDCPSYEVTNVTFSGPAADAYALADGVTLPIEAKAGQNLRVCIKSIKDTDGAAQAVLQTTAGPVTVNLKRDGVLSSVEEEFSVIEGLQVSPNPMRDQLVIRSPREESMNIYVHSVVGARVATMRGLGEVRWDGRDASGTRLSSGVYVLVIEQGVYTQVVKVILE